MLSYSFLEILRKVKIAPLRIGVASRQQSPNFGPKSIFFKKKIEILLRRHFFIEKNVCWFCFFTKFCALGTQEVKTWYHTSFPIDKSFLPFFLTVSLENGKTQRWKNLRFSVFQNIYLVLVNWTLGNDRPQSILVFLPALMCWLNDNIFNVNFKFFFQWIVSFAFAILSWLFMLLYSFKSKVILPEQSSKLTSFAFVSIAHDTFAVEILCSYSFIRFVSSSSFCPVSPIFLNLSSYSIFG